MPLEGLSSRLEENEEGKALLRFSDFSGGVGTRYAKEHRSDLRALLGYWYGYWDTWSPGMAHLPLLSEATTPTGITASKTDYASIIEAYLGGAWRAILAKGEHVWSTTGATWTAGTLFSTTGVNRGTTLSGGQGRQLLLAYVGGDQGVVWFPGANASIYFTSDGLNWTDIGWWHIGGPTPADHQQYCVCGWNQYCRGFATHQWPDDVWTPAKWRLYGIDPTTRKVVFIDQLAGNRSGLSAGSPLAWSGESTEIPAMSSTDVIPLGCLEDPSVEYLGNGPTVWAIQVAAAGKPDSRVAENVGVYDAGLPDITAGCRCGDRMAITDGTHRILLWHPTQDPIDVSLWTEDGVPDPVRGAVKALQVVGDHLIAWWEMDNASPVATANRGNTMIYWSRPNLQGQTTWHPRSGVLTGGFPRSCASPMVLSQKTVTGKRRLWVCTADTSAGRAYYQDHPAAGYNPTADTASTYAFEDGPKYLYTAFEPLQLMGDEAGAMTRVERHGIVSSTEVMDVAYRVNDDKRPEEPDPAGWDTLLEMKDTRRHVNIGAETGIQANTAQFRIGLDGASNKTPVFEDMGVRVERKKRAPTLERM
jgi:hypothetical protein